MSLSLHYPMIREATGNRRGPRFRRVPDRSGLRGAALCVAGMVTCAIRKRDLARQPLWASEVAVVSARVDRVVMRSHALWARVFAGQIRNDDPRLIEAEALSKRLVAELCAKTEAIEETTTNQQKYANTTHTSKQASVTAPLKPSALRDS